MPTSFLMVSFKLDKSATFYNNFVNVGLFELFNTSKAYFSKEIITAFFSCSLQY
jgi:hypothetical protein